MLNDQIFYVVYEINLYYCRVGVNYFEKKLIIFKYIGNFINYL